MHARLSHVHLVLLATLGLDLGCAIDTGSEGSTGASETSDTNATDTDTTDTTDTDATDTDATGTETGPEPGLECLDPTPIMQSGTDVPSGFVLCANGLIHRESIDEIVVPPRGDQELCVDNLEGECQTGADCAGPHPSCGMEFDDIGCRCRNGCMSDDDCAEGTICAPAGLPSVGYNRCIRAECDETALCDPGGLCALSQIWDGCDEDKSMTECAYLDSECLADADCTDNLICSAWQGQGFICEEEDGSVCGRPFVVAGEARVAPGCARSDWRGTAARMPELDMTPATRQRLQDYWLRVAQFEHASVASFARFGLDLLRLGAPAELVRGVQAAARDEVEHARLAFGLASAYAGAPLGPGALAIETAAPRLADARTIVADLIDEACVEETLAAIEAGEALSHTQDPAVAAVLEQVAEDELRHALLGWGALRWILAQADASLRAFALDHLHQALARAEARSSRQGIPLALRRHGLLDDKLRGQVRQAAIRTVLRPCAEALA